MAYEIGTASNLEDLFGKIVTFLTTNADLVAAGRQWTVNRIFRDNLANVTTNLTEQSGSVIYRKIRHSFRYTPRSINTNNPNDMAGHVNCSDLANGVSHFTMTLKAAEEIKTVRIVSANSSDASNSLQNFRLQYSDNGSTWTTALTVSSSPVYQTNETKNFAVPGTPGAHIYWRILIDSSQSANTVVTWKSCLLLRQDGTIANHFGSEVLFKAPGNAGTENIYTGLKSEYDDANGWYNLFIMGYTGFNPLVTDFFRQPGAIPGYEDPTPMACPMVPCWNSTMPYWFSANGRAFKFGVKVSTSFEGGYMGFFLPYATPSQYPYPIAIGGSLIPTNTARGQEWRYSYNQYKHSVFTTPAADNPAMSTSWATLYIRSQEGSWRSVGQRSSTSDPNWIQRMTISSIPPFTQSGPYIGVWPTCVYSPIVSDGRLPIREVLGGGYIFQPTILVQRSPSSAVLGELEDIFIVSGFGNSAENTAVFNGINHTIFQNVARLEAHEYWALALPTN